MPTEKNAAFLPTQYSFKLDRQRVKMDTGPFPGVKCGRGVLLTTHPLLVPRSWNGRVELYLYPPSKPHRACNGIAKKKIHILSVHNRS